MTKTPIFENLRRLKLLEAKVADIVKNGASSIEKSLLIRIPKMTTATQGSIPHGCN
jgi:hypothetical protein